MAKLIVSLKDKTLYEVVLSKDAVTTIGRNPSNTIHFENPAVSRFHAKIYKQEWPYYIEDLGSSNGTFINGSKVNWKLALKNNDRITIGKHTLVFLDQRSDYDDSKAPELDGTICV